MYKLIFSPPLRGRIKEGVSTSSSPSQGVTQKGFQRVETSPQPSPERRGRRILPPPSGEFLFSFRPSQGRTKKGFPLECSHRERFFVAITSEAIRRCEVHFGALTSEAIFVFQERRLRDLPACRAAAQAGGYY